MKKISISILSVVLMLVLSINSYAITYNIIGIQVSPPGGFSSVYGKQKAANWLHFQIRNHSDIDMLDYAVFHKTSSAKKFSKKLERKKRLQGGKINTRTTKVNGYNSYNGYFFTSTGISNIDKRYAYELFVITTIKNKFVVIAYAFITDRKLKNNLRVIHAKALIDSIR